MENPLLQVRVQTISTMMRSIKDEIEKTTVVSTIAPSTLKPKPVVSVVVVTYNHELFIEECLLSVLKQKTSFRFEVIVCDDGSSDGTPIILEKLAKSNKNLRVYRGRRENNIQVMNLPTARYNSFMGITFAQGEYLAWMDGDDFWVDENKLQNQFKAMRENPDWSMCFTLGFMVYLDGTSGDVWHPKKREYNSIECYTELTSKELASSRFFRTKHFKSAVPEWLLTSFCDFHMDLCAAKHGPIGHIPSYSSCYRIHSSNAYHGVKEHAKTRTQFYRNQQFLKHGGGESWLPPEVARRQFRHLIKSFDHPAIVKDFETITLYDLMSYGAFKHCSFTGKLNICTYWIFKSIQRKLLSRKPERKGELTQT